MNLDFKPFIDHCSQYVESAKTKAFFRRAIYLHKFFASRSNRRVRQQFLQRLVQTRANLILWLLRQCYQKSTTVELADAVIGKHIERGDGGIIAEAGIIARARRRCRWIFVVQLA